MKRNYLIFSLIFIVSTIVLTSILASVEIREFSITSDFAEDLRLDLPAYSFKETEPDIQTFYSIDYLLVFHEPLPESTQQILKKGKRGWKSTSDTTYCLERVKGVSDNFCAEINTSSGEVKLCYTFEPEFRGIPLLSIFLGFSLFALYLVISTIWFCVWFSRELRNSKFFNRTLVFDFGSTNTVVCEDGQVVFDERTAIAVMSNGHVFAGDRAFAYFSDINYKLIKPIEGGEVVDDEAFEIFVKAVVRKQVWFPRLCLKTVVIAVPNDMIQEGAITTSGKAYCEPFHRMGIKEVKMVPHGIAAYLGS